MKKITALKFMALGILGSFLLTSCSDDNDSSTTVTPTPKTIAGVATSDPQFSILVQALQKADLVTTLNGAGPFTVFAPTNTAFTKFLSDKGFASLDVVPTPDLKEILLNHVVSGNVPSTALSAGYIKTLAKGSASATNNLSMYVDLRDGVKLNGVAKVTTANVAASNGVVHIVDAVIDLPNIVTFAKSNPDFSILVSALTRTDMPDFAGILSGAGSFTVFAPNNTAFGNLLTELGVAGLADINTATLENTLKYHVVANANVLSSSLTEGQEVTTFQGGTFTIGLTGGAKITDLNNRISNIVAVDVQAANGVIHVIDKVILPVL